MVGIVKSRRKICIELEDWRGRQENERCNRRGRFPGTDEGTLKSFESEYYFNITFSHYLYRLLPKNIISVDHVVLCEHHEERKYITSLDQVVLCEHIEERKYLI